MAWIEIHQTLQRHPKTLRLSVRLGIHKAQAVGHLLFLWFWALDYAPSGDLSTIGPEEIAAAAEYPGNAEEFKKALEDIGWLNGAGEIHNWHNYVGKLIDRRETDRLRKNHARQLALDLRRTSDGHPVDGVRTVPNPTEPNQTIEEGTLHESSGSQFDGFAQQIKPAGGVKKPSQGKKSYSPESLEYKGAQFFWSYLREWSPQAIEPSEAGYQAWARDIDAMYRIDGRTSMAFNEVLDWINDQPQGRNGFSWRKTIHSPAKLRQRWNEGKFVDFLPSEHSREEYL